MVPQFIRSPSPGTDGTWRTADDDYGDLRLLPTSPCIDAAANWVVSADITTDLAGYPRFVDVPTKTDTGQGTAPIVDMGAYESPNPAMTVAGSIGDDPFVVRLSANGADLQVVGPTQSVTYATAAITSLAVAGGNGNDTLTIDFSNGNPIPSGGISYDGAAGTGDSLVIVGDSGSNVWTQGPLRLTRGGSTAVTYSQVEAFSFELGSGTLDLGGRTITAVTLRSG